MGHFHIQRKKNQELKDTQIKIAFRTRNTIQNVIKQYPRIQQKWHLLNEMPRLPIKTHRASRQNIPTLDTKNTYKQLEIIIAIRDIRATYETRDIHMEP
jgi:hypothetical protein